MWCLVRAMALLVVCWNDGLQGKPEEIRDEYLKDVQLLFY
jgi:hypothetical protein